jgi:gliding motility-associated-like protein
MKKLLFILLTHLFVLSCSASHIVGGEVFYEYLGVGTLPNSNSYRITVRLFTDCDQLCGGTTTVSCPPSTIRIGIFNNFAPYTSAFFRNIPLGIQPRIELANYPPCIDIKPRVCYQVNTYTTVIDLPITANGYRVVYQSCCRDVTVNVQPDPTTLSGQPGATYEAMIPGTNVLPVGHNSCAVVNLRDTSLICPNTYFNLFFDAFDADGDSLSYHFVAAYKGSRQISGPDIPAAPIYNRVDYQFGYAGYIPLGNFVTIDPNSGLISGRAPNRSGRYLVNVIIREWRNGNKIAEHGKDFLVRIDNCVIPNAYLRPRPSYCDSFTVVFQNDGNDINVQKWEWFFGDPSTGSNNYSTLQNPSHTFSSAGKFTIKLFLNRGLDCADSTEREISVYPGFKPDFKQIGECVYTPIQFIDLTKTDSGTVNFWEWHFYDPIINRVDTFRIQNPYYTFLTAGLLPFDFIVGNSKGCMANLRRYVKVRATPVLNPYPKDTLICTVDTLQIGVTATGTIVWSPNYMIDNVNTLTPLVSPDISTTYTATITDTFGCKGSDSIRINVVDKVTQGSDYDTIICSGDAIKLRLNSDALYFSWLPNDGSLNNATNKNPVASPKVNSVTIIPYTVIGKISNKCFAQNTINVKVVPYPNPIANDVSVCFGKSTQLNASGGSIYNWSPRAFLSSTIINNPKVINPTTSVLYTLTVKDTLGCPKPVQKTVKLNVVKINANAGPRDTSVVLGQPLQLFASGGTNYLWLPNNRWLSSTIIYNPIALPQSNIEYIVQVSDVNNCFAFDSIRVKLYTVKPGLYVPNAFTPNGDTKNDYFKPIALGIKSLDKFDVYNRWGQLVYSNTDLERGWDGTFGGRQQDPATFVWIAEATDYTGKKIKMKGTVVLIRQ